MLIAGVGSLVALLAPYSAYARIVQNLFSPIYQWCNNGLAEAIEMVPKRSDDTGIALSRHKRDEYFIATKLSNFAPATWPREESIKMFENSLKELQVDYIDYLLLHSIGGGEDCMQMLRNRYYDNSILDFLLEQREKGIIRNLVSHCPQRIRIPEMMQMVDEYVEKLKQETL